MLFHPSQSRLKLGCAADLSLFLLLVLHFLLLRFHRSRSCALGLPLLECRITSFRAECSLCFVPLFACQMLEGI